MSVNDHEGSSCQVTIKMLDDILEDFGLARADGLSSIKLTGRFPAVRDTNSEYLHMSLIGAIPSLANALAATQIFEARGGPRQIIQLDLRRSHNYLDPDIGMTPTINGQEVPLDALAGNPFISGIYETADGRHVVPSAVYIDLVYQWSTFLQCAVNTEDVAKAIKGWDSRALERAAEAAGLPFAIIESAEIWAATAQGKHLSRLPIVPVRRVVDSPPLSLTNATNRPLEGIKVLCLTHAIAGPSAGRTLAEYGASVLQIMYTHGFEHAFVYSYANLGCASSRLNLNRKGDRIHMWKLVREANVWIDSYRAGALAKFGFTDCKLHEANPHLIISHVRLYGTTGPWVDKPGFDMQGSASSGMMALCGGGVEHPAWPPGQVINDYTTGYYGALAIQAVILRQMKEGGGYIVSPSLAGTAMSIVKHYRTSSFPDLKNDGGQKLPPRVLTITTGMGVLKTLQPLPVLSGTPIRYDHSLSAMGSDLPLFPGNNAMGYPVDEVHATKKEDIVHLFKISTEKRYRELKDIRDKMT